MQKSNNVMVNDRLISIAIGGNRKATYWKNTQMLLSEMYAKLGNPVRSSMTGQ